MRGGEIVDVEPDVFGPAVGYEVLISESVRVGVSCSGGVVGLGCTFDFVFADVDEGRRVDDFGGEVVYHCVCCRLLK